MRAFVSDPAARKEQQQAQLAIARQAQADRQAIENMRRDMEAGRRLNSDDMRHLTHDHQLQIHARGDDAVRQMVEDARRRSQSRDEERERER